MILSRYPFSERLPWLILLEDGRGCFFRQRRSAIEGRFFDFLKFRSMVKGAEAQQDELNRLNQTEEGLFLLRRIPGDEGGTVYSEFSIDELPQLLNVFRGR
jgi:lipopolysaccharide/colanic/teichoic acid biosynthesis glycosyltransferase